MPNAILPVIGQGKFRRTTVQSLSAISLTASAQAQSQLDIPIYGDLIGIGFDVTCTASGTLSTPTTVNHAIQEVSIKDKSGIAIWQGIRGSDLGMLENFRNLGRARTVTVLTGAANNYYTFIPCNIEQKDQTARIQLTLAPYSDLASSGCTGASVNITVVAYYKDQSAITYTERFSRQTFTTTTGRNRLASFLPQGSLITDVFFSGTEAYLSSIDFSENGAAELSGMTVADLTALDNDRLTGGHVSTKFSLYVSPFKPNTTTVFDYVGQSSSDTVQLFLIEAR